MTQPLVAPPYGRDTAATSQVFHGRLVKDGELLAQAAYRRIITRRGDLLDDPDYGLGIGEWIGQDIDADFIASVPGRITQELTKDDRLNPENGAVLDVLVAPRTNDAGAVELDIDITGIGANGGGFALSLRVGDVRVELLNLGGTT